MASKETCDCTNRGDLIPCTICEQGVACSHCVDLCSRCGNQACSECSVNYEQCPDCGVRLCEACRPHPTLGVCACPASNMGHAYADMMPVDDETTQFHGAYGEERYPGPYKSRAQVARETWLVYAGPKQWSKVDHTCAACGKEDYDIQLLVCQVCKSVRYCSSECQEEHRTQHEVDCGPYLAPSEQPFFSRDTKRLYQLQGLLDAPSAQSQADDAFLEYSPFSATGINEHFAGNAPVALSQGIGSSLMQRRRRRLRLQKQHEHGEGDQT